MIETAVDAQERQEWLDALDAVVRHGGIQAGGEIVSSLAQHAENSGVPLPQAITTPISQHHPPRATSVPCPVTCLWSGGSAPWCVGMQWRWSCAPMTTRTVLGGHISSFSSSATLYDMGMNHFFRGHREWSSR